MKRSDAAVIISELRVDKNKTPILRSCSFSITTGSVVGLIGPSGSGKTTIMRTIVGLQTISSGSVVINGFEAGDKRLRGMIGYVSQEPSVYEDITVLQNLHYFCSLLGVTSRAAKTVLQQVDLLQQADQLVSSLSGGQRARVSLAIALLGDPDVLVLDEPTVGLDPVLRVSLWKLFHRLASIGKTLIVSSHVMDEADRCDTIVLMREGRLLYSGSRKDLLKRAHAKSVESAFLSLVEAK